jgi:hypothetical protein
MHNVQQFLHALGYVPITGYLARRKAKRNSSKLCHGVETYIELHWFPSLSDRLVLIERGVKSGLYEHVNIIGLN